MAADSTLTAATRAVQWRGKLFRLPPGGHAWTAQNVIHLVRNIRDNGLREMVRSGLAETFPELEIDLHTSGRAALAWSFRALADRSGRSEIVIPAYTCYSVPAAAVSAGLRIRLVDVDLRGQIDINDLKKLPLERAAAIVVTNLLGIPESVDSLKTIVSEAGCSLIDDAAQCFGASDSGGRAGARGEVGILSFGRGKPLSALGGGAAVYRAAAVSGCERPRDAGPGRASVFRAIADAMLYDIALRPSVFRLLCRVPSLGVGETRFDPGFERGGMDGRHQALLSCGLDNAEEQARSRRRVAESMAKEIQSVSLFKPLVADGAVVAVYPRLGVIAPSPDARNQALIALTAVGAGATAFYPESLDCLEALKPHMVEERPCSGAHELAGRLLTLPTHGGLRGRRLREVLAIFQKIGHGAGSWGVGKASKPARVLR